MTGTAADAVADIGLRIIKEHEARIAELEGRVVDLEVFVHAVSASTKSEIDADNWREWKEWADELLK